MNGSHVVVPLLDGCPRGGKGYTEEPYAISVLRIYCACPAGIAYKAERMKIIARQRGYAA